jgi:putative transposase
MPRPPRLEYPGITLHVVQRGNNRQVCFFRDRDREYYLHQLGKLLHELSCELHAYVLMTNHVHLMLTPSEPGTVSRLMRALGSAYVRFINASLERTGTLWEGRFKSCPVDTAGYALACIRYIELNPVRAGMVRRPEEYRWSSFHCNALGNDDPLLTSHRALEALAVDPGIRRTRYLELVEAGVDAKELESLRLHARRQKAWGSLAFSESLEAKLGVPTSIRRPGPPIRNVTK